MKPTHYLAIASDPNIGQGTAIITLATVAYPDGACTDGWQGRAQIEVKSVKTVDEAQKALATLLRALADKVESRE